MRPLYVGRLTEEETTVLKAGLRSPSAFTVRRCQILLKSAKWQTASQLAKALDCSDQTVREAIRAYHQEGLDCLREKSHARHDQQPTINEAGCGRLKEISRLSPRTFGFQTSVWTRPLLAKVLSQEGYTGQQVSPSAITAALKRVDVAWRRAKQWLRSPDPHYERRKKDEIS
ncbi:MAG: helix-turn-helix domain-containing protein [Anaerolineales bacterium]|nr:helix-turn-helix domain-containing protein [Anaerolineales bacterium]